MSGKKIYVPLIAAMTVSFVVAMGAVAVADNFQNDVTVGGSDTISVGGSTVVTYRLIGNNSPSGDVGGCNVDATHPATVTISAPAAVTKSVISFQFTACGNAGAKTVTYGSATAGNYLIDVSISGGVSGALYNDQADFTLHVLAPADTTPPVITHTITGTLGSGGWYTDDVTVAFNVNDPDSTVTSKSADCDATNSVTSDTLGVTFTCTATSAGGTASDSVTIKRDATPPSITGTPTFGDATAWVNAPVTITYTCSDATSGLAGLCPGDESRSAEGEYTITKTISDQAGNSASTTAYVNIDLTNPTITGSASPGANFYGWNNSDVTVHFECADNLSGLASCEPDHVLGEGADQSVTGSAQDNAGNSASATVSGVNVDKTAPTIQFVGADKTPTNGWYNSDVTFTWNCSDPLSGVVSSTVTQTLTSEGAGQSASGTCTDKAGNTASDTQTGINIDKTLPTILFVSRTPAANSNGWNNTDVTVDWSCSDAGSGVVAAAVSQTVTTEGEDQSATGTCEDLAGNTASHTQTGISIDKTAPTASASASPAANSNGWNNTDVTVSFSGTDTGGSGIDFCSTVLLTTEAAGQSASGTCTDRAGNVSATATASGINIDKTAPSVSLVGGPANGASYYFGSVPAAPTCTASDALSELAGPCSVSGYSALVGDHTVSASATDNAGNVGSSDSRAYTVLAWTLNGFYQPVDMGGVWNTVKGGSTVPLKFEVFAGPTELTDPAVVDSFSVKGVACPSTGLVTDDIELITTGGTTLRYDSTGGQFIQNWQTPKKPGACYTVTMKTDDGTSISANFKLK